MYSVSVPGLKYSINKLNRGISLSDQQKQSFQILFAGASVAFGLPFLLIEVIGFIFDMELYTSYPTLFGVAYISLYVFGGIIGGSLATRTVETKHITRAGVTIGLIAFFIQQVISFIFFGAGVLGDTYTLFALVGGSIMGSIYTKQNRKRLEKELIEKEAEEAVEESSEEES
jgi:hypothetical protein